MERINEDIEIGSNNVFQDLDYDNPEEWTLKANISQQITTLLEKKDLSDEKAAATMGISSGAVRLVKCGIVRGFSIKELLNWQRELSLPF